MSNNYTRIILELREKAESMDFTKRLLLRKAADSIENLQKDIAAREYINERQASHTRHLVNLNLLKDDQISQLENELKQAREERDILAQRITQLEKENFWLTNGGGEDA